MIEGQNIIYIGNDWFTENKTSSHHIAELLSEKNTILYIEGAGQRAPHVSGRDFKKIILKFKKITNKPINVRKNLFVYSPFLLPFHKYGFVRKFNAVLLKFQIKKVSKEIGIFSPILWILLPHYYSLAGKMDEKGVVYYCVDEYSAQPDVDSSAIKEMEKCLLEQANVVFAVSDMLCADKIQTNPNTYLSLHGVDVHHFNCDTSDEKNIHDDISRIKKPIIGFFGLLQQRVDLNMIKFCAHKRPDFSFVLIGLVAQDISGFSGMKNVHFLGVKPYNELPAYLNLFDVAILPYQLNDEMINSNPKKLREYMAAGKPVVSVRIKEVEKYKDLVYITDDYNEFLKCIEIAVADDTPEKRNARIKAMESESWENRFEQVCEKVTKHIKL